jgi:hypothetical protein
VPARAGHLLILLGGAGPRLTGDRLRQPCRAHLRRRRNEERATRYTTLVDICAWLVPIFVGGDVGLPRLAALDVVVVAITLGDLFLLML